MRPEDVDIVVTNCYRPAWTARAVESIRQYYLHNRIIIIDDCCIECGPELAEIEEQFDAEIVLSPKRRGCGRALDLGMTKATSKWVLTVDHGITLTKAGVVELLLEYTTGNTFAIGEGGGTSSACGRRFGPFVLCPLALWDREFIVRHGLTFKLTGLYLPGGETVGGCTTGAYLCYRGEALGGEQAFLRLHDYFYHEHSRDTFGKKFPSPHEPVHLEGDEIDLTPYQVKRRRRKSRGKRRR